MKAFISEFKKFALKGNMIDLAIGVMIATAFNNVVSSIVNDILMPIFGVILGGRDFSALAIEFGAAKICYGLLIQNLINFFIISFCLFIAVKSMNKLMKHNEKEEAEEPKKPDDIVLLEEIRDALTGMKEKTTDSE